MSLLPVEDPFLVKYSGEVFAILSDSEGVPMSAFSLDLKDLFASLPQKCLFGVVRDCTDMFAEVSLQNKVGYSSGFFFFELLQAYLEFLIVAFQEKKYSFKMMGSA